MAAGRTAAMTGLQQVGTLHAGALPSHSFPRTSTPGPIPMCPLLPHTPQLEHYNPPRNGISHFKSGKEGNRTACTQVSAQDLADRGFGTVPLHPHLP